MYLIGVDYHPSFQTIAFFVEETGEYGEQDLNHSDGKAEKFYRDLKQREVSVRVGMEATGYSRWFERLLAELGFGLWIGEFHAIRHGTPSALLADGAAPAVVQRQLRHRDAKITLERSSHVIGDARTAVENMSARLVH